VRLEADCLYDGFPFDVRIFFPDETDVISKEGQSPLKAIHLLSFRDVL
jgi:hypothetical protein